MISSDYSEHSFKSQEDTLEWLLVQKDPAGEAIIALEGDELQKAIERTESVAVFVCEWEF